MEHVIYKQEKVAAAAEQAAIENHADAIAVEWKPPWAPEIRTKPWSVARRSGNQKPKLQTISLQDAALVGVPWLPR